MLGKDKTLEKEMSSISISVLSDQLDPSIIKKTWKELMKNEREVATKIYEFVLTKEISMSVLFIHSQIDRQSLLFMRMLDTVVGYLDDQQTMDEQLLVIGTTHTRRYGVRNEHYKHFRTAFMKAIKLFIPWSDRREKAWFNFWEHIIKIMSMSAQNETMLFGISSQTLTEYILAIHESFDNAKESSIFANSLYTNLLNEQCEIAKLFSQADFEVQSVRFVSMLSHIIRLLEDKAAFQNKVISLSHQYRDYGISVAEFKLFGDVFIETLRSLNDDMWNYTHERSWEWLWSVLAELYQTGLNKNQNSTTIVQHSTTSLNNN